MYSANVTAFLLNKTKASAKKSKLKYPDLTYNQRLDIAAREICGRENYHELKKHHDKYLAYISFPEGISTHVCPYCHIHFCPDEKSDVEQHEKNHRKWEIVEYALNYLPNSYEKREQSKKDAYKKIHDGNSFQERFEGVLQLIRAHYDRSLDTAIDEDYWKEHPDFETFVAMSDYSNILPKDLVAAIKDKYGEIKEGIGVEKSYWFPNAKSGSNYG
jgi:hypothetical protein